MITSTMFVGFLRFTQSAVDYATQKQVFVGNIQSGAKTADQFRTQTLCPQLPITVDCSNIIVSLQTVPGDQAMPALLRLRQFG